MDPKFLAEIDRLRLEFRRWKAGDGAGDLATRKAGHSALFREHRAYVAGDDPRRIDWDAYLRIGDLLTRTTEAEEAPRLTFLLDKSESMRLHGAAKLRSAARLIGALGAIALFRGAIVEFHCFPSLSRPAQFRGRQQLAAFIRELAQKAASPPDTSPAALTLPHLQGRDRGPALLLTDLFESEGLLPALRSLRASRSMLHIVHLTDQRDLELPANDPHLLVDCEKGSRLRLSPTAALAKAYAQEITSHFDHLRRTASTYGITYHHAPHQTPLQSLLKSLLRNGLT